MVSELNCFSLSLGMRCSHLLLEFGSEQLPLSLGFELNCLSPSLGVWMRLFELNCMFPSLGSDEFWSRMDSIDWIHHSSIGWTHRPSISWLGSATYHSSPRWTYKVWWICCIVLELCADLGLGELLTLFTPRGEVFDEEVNFWLQSWSPPSIIQICFQVFAVSWVASELICLIRINLSSLVFEWHPNWFVLSELICLHSSLSGIRIDLSYPN
jgi:hypothetical protein